MRKTRWWLLLILLIAGILVGIAGCFGEQGQYQPVVSKAGVRFGDVIVDQTAGEIYFSGRVRQNKGWVRFLVCLSGYRWLEEEAAIVSPADLVNLQMAIALLDWQVWDELWHRETTGEKIDVFLKWQGGKADANELVQLSCHLGIGDLIFLGSPFFDPLFLERCSQTLICLALKQGHKCPLYFLQESVEGKFTRADGRAGYRVNTELLPPPGTEVTVIIRVPNPRGGG